MIKADMRRSLDALIAESHELSDHLDEFRRELSSLIEGMEELRREMRNRPPVTHGRNVSERITPEKVAEIRRLHLDNPTMPQHEIARRANVNQGRVSEVLAGIRT